MTNPPPGFHTITPYLVVKGANAAIAFYKRAFGASEHYRLPGPNETIVHAEMQWGSSRFLLADEFPDQDVLGPQTRGGTTVSMLVYVADVDAAMAQAVAAGATIEKPAMNQFWGDRMGTLRDPFGHSWSLAAPVEEVSPEEIARRFAALMASGGAVDSGDAVG